ncbi:peptide deformylase [Candidatus Wolfebacteria bacterium]|nr:peptide deformylase [Candidatus Wolfebacteria bacterium]
MKIFTVNNKKEEKFLRKKTPVFDFSKFSPKEIRDLIKEMKEMMKIGDGVGLSANQIGLNLRVFVAQIPYSEKTEASKFYVIFNPEIKKNSKEKIEMEEGCLSIPGVFGLVNRPEKITLIGKDKNNREIKIKAHSFLARVFQHETDHLNGILFIDKTKKVYKISQTNEKQL